MSAVTSMPSARALSSMPSRRSAWPHEAVHGELDVRDLHRDLRLAADAQDLVDRLPEVAVLAADVADVAAAVAAATFARSTTSGARGVDAGVVLEAGGEAERARLHARARRSARICSTSAGGRLAAEVLAHHVAAERAVADVGGDVDRGRRLSEAREEVGQRAGREPPSWPATMVVMPWLADGARVAVSKRPSSSWLWVSMKPGASARPWASIDALAAPRLEVADLGDAVAVDAHGARPRGRAGAVDDEALTISVDVGFSPAQPASSAAIGGAKDPASRGIVTRTAPDALEGQAAQAGDQ